MTSTINRRIKLKAALVRIPDGYLDFVRGYTVEAIYVAGAPRLYTVDGGPARPLVLTAAALVRLPSKVETRCRLADADALDAWEADRRVA